MGAARVRPSSEEDRRYWVHVPGTMWIRTGCAAIQIEKLSDLFLKSVPHWTNAGPVWGLSSAGLCGGAVLY